MRRTSWGVVLGLWLCAGAGAAAVPGDVPADGEVGAREAELLERIARLEAMVLELKEQVDAAEMGSVLARLHALEAEDADDLHVRWKDGLRLEKDDGSVKLKVGGRIQTDFQNARGSSALEALVGETLDDDAAEIRRARLFVSGEVDGLWEYKAQFDFADADSDLKDVYVGLKDSPVGGIRVGHFKEPFSLEELTSSKYLTFTERALPNAFAPARNIGVMVHDHTEGEALNWALGLFKTSDDGGDSETADGEWGLTGRLSGTPHWREGEDGEGPRFVHLGAGFSRRSDEETRVRARPEVHLGPRLIDTGVITGVDGIDLYNVEAAFQCGPFSISGEHVQFDVDREGGLEDLEFDGQYVQASWFLTEGDQRGYSRSKGTFSRVRPERPFAFGERGGPGAWEVAARVSHLDVEDGGFTLASGTGGELDDTSFGLNWYLNDNVRVLWNYIEADLEDAGEADTVTMRVQVEF